jgi:hypothetical protein
MDKKEYITLDELLTKFNQDNKTFIDKLDDEEKASEHESIDDIEKEINDDKLKTEYNKNKFINELKNGLGQNIKQNPDTIKKVEKTKPQKVKEFFINIFTKF